MLTELRIENFAIIQHLDLQLKSGLTTFTGETGAGKSIILDALEALVGGRAEPTQIRSGTERALLEATFCVPETYRKDIHAILEREALLDDPDQLVLSRELRREGRSVGRINGRATNTSLMREIGSYLVDIHGQSEHLSLLNVRQHLGLLDRYTNNETDLAAYQKTYHQLIALRRELAALRQSEQDAARRTELLNFQAGEIESAQLKSGEEEELRQERDRLANAESLTALAQQVLLLLDEGSPETQSVAELLGQATHSLGALSRIDASKTRLHEQATVFIETLADIIRELRNYLEQVEFNPRRLEQAEERLNLIHTLKRKYGNSIEAVLAFGCDARQKLETIAHSSERIAEMETAEKNLLEQITRQGLLLSQQRKQSSESLEKGVEAELVDLNMSGARFSVDIHHDPNPQGLLLENGNQVAFDDCGLDRVEFMIAPNPGEGFKPLVKIASGGETSRLMLALKNVLTRADYVPTLIFDEIDQGIGGRVGMVVGEKLWQLARQHQVFCVTHLPQLAAFGDQHLRVRKLVDEGRTLTVVDILNSSTRLDELAQMMGNLSETNRASAQEIIQLAQQRARQLSGKA